jgi:hypothetical protein
MKYCYEAFMIKNPLSAADGERVVQMLSHVERRCRRNSLTREWLTGFTLSLIVPIVLSAWYKLSPLSWLAVVTVVSLWFAALIAYASWMFLRRKSLASVAVAVDKKAALDGELTTAYWFYRKGLNSAWINLQRGRAARSAEMLDLTKLFPYSVPKSSRLTVALLALCFILNLIPLSWTRGWLQADPLVFDVVDQNLVNDEARQILSQAELIDGLESIQLSEDFREQLIQRQLSVQDEVEFREMRLTEGNWSLESDLMEALMKSMAEALDGIGSDALVEGVQRKDFEMAARELRDLAQELDFTEADLESLKQSLNELAEMSSDELEALAEELTEAAGQLSEENNEAMQHAFEQLAEDLEQMIREQQRDELREAAAERLDQLEQAAQHGQGSNNEQQLANGEPSTEDQMTATPQEGDTTGSQTGTPMETGGPGVPTDEQGQGDLSAPGAGDIIEYGSPTSLEVELQAEILEVQPQPSGQPDDRLVDQPSQASQSILQYEEIGSTISYKDSEILDAGSIPWLYRDLVKQYFQAVGPR